MWYGHALNTQIRNQILTEAGTYLFKSLDKESKMGIDLIC